MRKAFLFLLLLGTACQGTVTVNEPDGGDAGSPVDSGIPGSIPTGDAGCAGGCAAPTPYCAANGSCVECLSDTDCAGQTGPHCDTRAASSLYGTCVECVAGATGQCGTGAVCDPAADNCVAGCNANPATCSANSQICDPTSGACVDCLTDSDCLNTGLGVRCDATTHACVDCLQPSDCPLGTPGCFQGSCGSCSLASDCPGTMTCLDQTCGCASASNCLAATPVCVPDGGAGQPSGGGGPVCGCLQKSDCAAAGSGDVCDPNRGFSGVCVPPCKSAGDCTADPNAFGPACDSSTGLCVQCVTSADCTDPQSPVCVGSYCGQCGADTDCSAMDAGAPFCVPTASQGTLCVECRTAADCPAGNPGCDSSSNSCGSCTLNSDCPAGQSCLADAGSLCG